MSKTKNITPKNNNRERHGLWKTYNYNGDLWFKRFYNNGKEVGYEEYYSYNGILSRKRYHI